MTGNHPAKPAGRRGLPRWVRAALLAASGAVALALAARAWLLRDPVPYFEARRTRVANVAEGPVNRAGDALDQDVTVTGANGLRVEMRIRRRADTRPGTRQPLFVLLGGATNGKESASLVGDPQGLLVASLSYPVYGNDRATGLAVIPEVPAFRRAIWDTPPTVMLALDYLLARPDVDTTRVELVGASFGAPFAAVVGALDHRVTRVWLVQGGANPRALIDVGLREEIRFAPARAFVASLANVLASGPRFDPARWVGRISPRPVVMINTEQDERIPRASAEQLHAAARDPKQVVWLPGLHMQPNRPDVLRALVDAVFQRLR
ncbi:MAG: hypothetical protein U9Q74_03710 [Gemmatimonadota bacterium]|nr:hypothetical protein [Gemmatimonadota bacterium]